MGVTPLEKKQEMEELADRADLVHYHVFLAISNLRRSLIPAKHIHDKLKGRDVPATQEYLDILRAKVFTCYRRIR